MIRLEFAKSLNFSLAEALSVGNCSRFVNAQFDRCAILTSPVIFS
jgi:hypothetical protein